MAFILLLAFGIMRFLIAQKEEPPVRRSIEARRYVTVEVVAYDRMESMVREKGRLASVAEVNILAEASGKIQAGDVLLKKGATFHKGDLLFTIYPDEAILALQASKSQYQNILAGILPDLAIDFPEAEPEFHRFFSSIAVDRPLPPLPDIGDDKLKIFLAANNVLSQYYNIESAELQLKRRSVYAPFDGTFLNVNMEIGAYTNTGGNVATAIRTDQLELEVPLTRADAAWVSIGDQVSVRGEVGQQWTGQVIRKSQFIDENTQRQSVFIRLLNRPDAPLMAGEYLTATFPTRPIDAVMEIPRNAIANSNEVFLVKQDRLTKSVVEVVKQNDRTLLFRGIPEGDTIVIQQLINATEGTLVQTDKSAPQMGPGQRNPGQGGPGQGNPGQAAAAPGDTGEKQGEGSRQR
ncbi:MAG: efflux RND transporter periplasmic adaptor subunit [Bacteroidales bacterium]